MSSAATTTETEPIRTADPGPAAFLEGLSEGDRLTGLLGYALWRQNPAGFNGLSPAETVVQAHRRAEAELAASAVRFLHNRVEEIKAEAIRERLGELRAPPSFFRLVLASSVAFAIGLLGVIYVTASGLLPTLLDAARQFGLAG